MGTKRVIVFRKGATQEPVCSLGFSQFGLPEGGTPYGQELRFFH